MTFEDRIRKRWQLWWGPPSWRRPFELPDRVHRWTERRVLRGHRDADATWRCCDHWQRSLLSKWNSREFAKRHGCRVPDLYWSGRNISRLPFDDLPDAFVIRPSFGDSRRGVFVLAQGVELLSGKGYPRARLEAALRKRTGRWWDPPLLVEEFVRSEDGVCRLPIEYRCHVFGETVGAVEVVLRGHSGNASRFGFFTPDWKPLDPGYMDPNPITAIEAPRCLEEMLDQARRLGLAFETYVRVDCYSSDKGCVFGEFSSTPASGMTFTPFVNRYFERLWQENLGELV